MSDGRAWSAPTAGVPVDATVRVPASKSLMARALVLAALADEPTTVHNPLVARDSLLMAEALRRLGAAVATTPNEPWRVTPGPPPHAPTSIDCGLSGTVMRFVPPIAALTAVDVRLDGDHRARERPLRGLLDALRALGVRTTPAQAVGLPVVVHGAGGVEGGSVTLDASESSQYVSGLLLAGCRYQRGLSLRTVGAVPSAPHVAMTVHALRARGVDVAQTGPGQWSVAAGVPTGGQVCIEPDVSNAAPFLAAALATGGQVRVPGWPRRTAQPADTLTGLLERLGAEVTVDEQGLRVTGGGGIRGLGEVDLAAVGELTPTIAALAALADSPTSIGGVAHLRGHETDRLGALVEALRALGGTAEPTPDGLRVEPAGLHGALLRSHGDHRMATFAAIVGLVVPGVTVDDVSVVDKTMPEFPDLWTGMLR